MSLHPSSRPGTAQRGSAALEFAIVSVVLFAFVFGTIEVARALFLWSTLSEVVGRAARLAAVTRPADEGQVRQQAMFRNGAGRLLLGGNIDPTYLRIDYLDRFHQEISSPPAPMDNLINCTRSPSDAGCVRFVRVRLCMPNTDCTPVPYLPLTSLDAVAKFNVRLPKFTTVVAADSLGLPAAGGQ